MITIKLTKRQFARLADLLEEKRQALEHDLEFEEAHNGRIEETKAEIAIFGELVDAVMEDEDDDT